MLEGRKVGAVEDGVEVALNDGIDEGPSLGGADGVAVEGSCDGDSVGD